MENNIQEQEEIITGTLLECTNEILKLRKQKNINLNESLDEFKMYKFNFRSLLNNIQPLFENVEQLPKISPIQLDRNNYYSYFKKIQEYIDDYSPIVLQTLNESLIVNETNTKNPTQLNIETFQKKLNSLIAKLEKIDEVSNYSPEILKIKAFAKKPIFVYGYDIMTNIALHKELEEKFNVTNDNLLSICFDKTNKSLLFICNDFSKTICYDIKTNKLDLYNNLNDDKLKATNVSITNYLSDLKEAIHNNIVELYINTNLLNLKFSDNLYNDTTRKQYSERLIAQARTIKQ